MADPNSVLTGLPPAIQAALGWGIGLGGTIVTIIRLLPPKAKSQAPSDDAKAIAQAATMPASDANQLRLISESLGRLSDAHFRTAGVVDDVRDNVRDLKEAIRDLKGSRSR